MWSTNFSFFQKLLFDIVAYPTENLSNVALRIVGGTVAKDAEFPYVAGLVITLQSGRKTPCAGSLISTTSILTAAHCLHKGKRVKIILGTTNITEHSTDKSKRTFVSTEFIIHPDYRGKAKKLNDLAIIKLPHPAALNEHVEVISIPTDDKETYDGQSGTAMGWGQTSDDPIQKDLAALRYVNNTIISNEVCIKSHPELKLLIRDTHVCQSGKGAKGTCHGDSGGPLVVDGVQIGVLAFGYRLCEQEIPATFTRLSKYIDWIKANK